MGPNSVTKKPVVLPKPEPASVSVQPAAEPAAADRAVEAKINQYSTAVSAPPLQAAPSIGKANPPTRPALVLTDDDDDEDAGGAPIPLRQKTDLVLRLSTPTTSGFVWQICEAPHEPSKTDVSPAPVTKDQRGRLVFGATEQTTEFRWRAEDLPKAGKVFTITAEAKRRAETGPSLTFTIQMV